MPNITYKTVLASAIKGFNDIQHALAGVHYNDGNGILSSVSTGSNGLLTNGKTPAELVVAIGKLAKIQKRSGANEYVSGEIKYINVSTNTLYNAATSTSIGAITITPVGNTEIIRNGNKISFSKSIVFDNGYYEDSRRSDGKFAISAIGEYEINSAVATITDGGLTKSDSITTTTDDTGVWFSREAANLTVTTDGYLSSTPNISLPAPEKSTFISAISIPQNKVFSSVTLKAGANNKKTTLGSLVLEADSKITTYSGTGSIESIGSSNTNATLNIGTVEKQDNGTSVVNITDNKGLVTVVNSDTSSSVTVTGGTITLNNTQDITKITGGAGKEINSFDSTATIKKMSGDRTISETNDDITITKNKGTITVTNDTANTAIVTVNSNVEVKNKTVKIGSTTVTNDVGTLKTATPAYSGGTLSTAADFGTASNAVLEDVTATDTKSGILIEATSSGGRTAFTYNGKVEGWLNAADGTPVTGLEAADSNSNTPKTKALKELTIINDKSLTKVTINTANSNVTGSKAGTLKTLTNNGLIEILNGNGTIGTLSGTINIDALSTGATAKANINVKTSSNSEYVSLVKDGLISMGSLANEAQNDITYNENKSIVLKSGDYLYINSGWFENTKISLANLIPDINGEGKIDAIDSSIKAGHYAYNEEGALITGAMGAVSTITNWSTYFTTTSNNLITIGADKYTDNTYYIKEASDPSISMSGDAGTTTIAAPTINTNIKYTTSETANGLAISPGAVTAGKVSVTPKLTITNAGWIGNYTSTAFSSYTANHGITNNWNKSYYINRLTIPNMQFGGSIASTEGITLLSSARLYLGLSGAAQSLYIRENGKTDYFNILSNNGALKRSSGSLGVSNNTTTYFTTSKNSTLSFTITATETLNASNIGWHDTAASSASQTYYIQPGAVSMTKTLTQAGLSSGSQIGNTSAFYPVFSTSAPTGTNYAVVEVTCSMPTATTGWISDFTNIDTGSMSAYITAHNGGSLTVSTSFNTATTFSNGSMSAPSKSFSDTNTSIQTKDKYLLGNVTANVSVDVEDDFTGTMVDYYLLAAYNRLNGIEYANITHDKNSSNTYLTTIKNTNGTDNYATNAWTIPTSNS